MRLRHLGLAAVVLALGLGPSPEASAQRPPLTVTAIRSWSSPTGTRIVIDFSAVTAYVAPDSGVGRKFMVTVPGEPVARAEGVQPTLVVRDGVIDSLVTITGVDGARFHVWLADSNPFRVFALPADEDKPYRLVLDVTKRGAAAAEAKRLEGIAQSKRSERTRIVAVDAGHGGVDTGAKGPRGVLEKNVCLNVARALVEELNQIKGVRGVLVRDGDYFIPLRDRYRSAEKMKADVFISIHANSSRRRGSGNGTEVYFLSLRGASDQADDDLADLENAADKVGGIPEQSEGDLVGIMYDVKRNSALRLSQLLAEKVLDEVAAGSRLESRGVKQAGFVVLKSVEFPSVLVETAFINNPTEARLLNSKEFQRKMAKQLATGVKAYFDHARIGLAEPTGANASP